MAQKFADLVVKMKTIQSMRMLKSISPILQIVVADWVEKNKNIDTIHFDIAWQPADYFPPPDSKNTLFCLLKILQIARVFRAAENHFQSSNSKRWKSKTPYFMENYTIIWIFYSLLSQNSTCRNPFSKFSIPSSNFPWYYPLIFGIPLPNNTILFLSISFSWKRSSFLIDVLEWLLFSAFKQLKILSGLKNWVFT